MRPLVDLLLLSAMLGAFWRAEVEWHGWYGLIWVQYFHWAVPVGVLAFLAWLAQTPVVVHTGKRWGLLGLASFHALFTVVLVHTFLFGIFQRFSVFRLEFLIALCVLGLLAPVVSWGLGRLLGHPLRLWTLGVSVALLVGSPFLAVLALSFVSPVHADTIHAVKSGMVIPFVVFAFGFPWAAGSPSERAATPASGSDSAA